MLRTGLDTPLLVGPSIAARLALRCLRSCYPGIILVSCGVVGASQCFAQDAAEAARQESAQKQTKQKKSKHIYTEEDLKRAQILTPEDRAQVQAKKSQAAPPSAEKSQGAVDAQSLPPDAPLGDVARRFRKLSESQKLHRSAEFHLPFADAPALASPKPAMKPPRPPVSNPGPPRFAPYRPPVKHSPFERPKVFTSAPPRVLSAPPPAVRTKPALPIAPAASAKLNVVTVKRGDSLWKLAQQNLGKGLRWHDLLAVNPGIVDANRIVAGSRIYVPASVSSLRTATRITVRKGDTLSQIAQIQFGHASFWSCIVHVNPAIRDANLIFEGQSLLLPANCNP